ncbi:tetraacyldisaccharide 4'-kinase [Orbaceae bacterium ESL0721]|nr:tetraacyldisaccharide 4'-kinase [Orbaceae bacterium ESL0721]
MNQLIEKLWYGKSKLYWLLIPFSYLYGLIAKLRRYIYRKFKQWKPSIPVVVVGNLTVGGNGKTPLVITLIDKLQQRGFKVGVVSRGYGGNAKQYPLILTEKTTTAEAGDEPVLIYRRTKVPFAVDANRCAAVKALLDNFQLDLILTDDGLQHYQLGRDVEIVVIDSKRKFGNGWWLPAGPMREKADRLQTVDMIIFNGENSELCKESSIGNSTLQKDIVNRYIDKTYIMQLEPLYAINLISGEKKALSDLKQIVAMAGISNPNRFFTMLKQLNANLIGTKAFADHQNFNFNLLKSIANDHQTLLMTEKDAVKCQSFAQPNWWYLPIDAVIPDQAIDQLISLIDMAKLQK